jgi:hypothetical protein
VPPVIDGGIVRHPAAAVVANAVVAVQVDAVIDNDLTTTPSTKCSLTAKMRRVYVRVCRSSRVPCSILLTLKVLIIVLVVEHDGVGWAAPAPARRAGQRGVCCCGCSRGCSTAGCRGTTSALARIFIAMLSKGGTLRGHYPLAQNGVINGGNWTRTQQKDNMSNKPLHCRKWIQGGTCRAVMPLF